MAAEVTKARNEMSPSRAATITVVLPESAVIDLSVEAAALGMTPEEWIKRLVQARVTGEPPWTAEDLGGMRDAAEAIRQLCELHQANEAHAQGERVTHATVNALMQRINAATQRHTEYWGKFAPPSAEDREGEGGDTSCESAVG